MSAPPQHRPNTASPALARRLRAAPAVLLEDEPGRLPDPWLDAADVLAELVRSVRRDPAPERLWLLYTAISTVFPTADELVACRRAWQLCSSDDEAGLWLLRRCLSTAIESGWAELDIDIVVGEVLVDVHFAATNSLHTGIQRVVRSAVPHWYDHESVRLVGWTPNSGTLRALRPGEERMVRDWAGRVDPDEHAAEADARLIVPWRSVLVLAEVPARTLSERIAGLAQHSGNVVTAIGYDCIPIVSADLVPAVETERFVEYLGVIKHVRKVAAISVSAATEFGGFSRMLATQGLPGPVVTECTLPAPAARPRTEPEPGATPTVLCVGSFEPRKNQLALLYAAEVLWREGLRFRLQFIGGSVWGREFPRRVRQLRSLGREVSTRSNVSESELTAAYAGARFTVFTSVHEGYGLPVVESLAAGTPVITSNFGSLAEIGAGGGAVLVDPRADEDLVATMRDLLIDDERIAELRAEIAARRARSWADYADDLWNALVVPYLHPLAAVTR